MGKQLPTGLPFPLVREACVRG